MGVSACKNLKNIVGLEQKAQRLTRIYTVSRASAERIKKMDKKISVKVCLGTTCFVMGSANLQELIEMVPKKYGEKVDVSGVPCLGLFSIDWEFSKAPYVKVDDEVIKEATVEKVLKAIDEKLSQFEK